MRKSILLVTIPLAIVVVAIVIVGRSDRDQRDPDLSTGPSVSVSPAVEPRSKRRVSSPQPVLAAFLELESSNDAKCHSTACRFENFVYGTSLIEDS